MRRSDIVRDKSYDKVWYCMRQLMLDRDWYCMRQVMWHGLILYETGHVTGSDIVWDNSCETGSDIVWDNSCETVWYSMRHDLPNTVSTSSIWFPLNNLNSHLKLIHNITEYKRQAKFDFGLYHFYFRSGVISLNLPKNANFVDCHSLIQFPVLKQIVWNWYGSSETIKGRPGLISDFNIFSFWRIIPFLLKKSDATIHRPRYSFYGSMLMPLITLVGKRGQSVSYEHIFF